MLDLEKIRSEKPIQELLNFSIINLDKPAGQTSFMISDMVKNLLEVKKSGHTGTLDPKVTGVLPVLLNNATKLAIHFSKSKKEYVGIMRIHKSVSLDELKEEAKNFLGKINQLPPVKSRVKRQEREREIYSFELLEKEEQEILFKVECEAGTYIRKLVHDFGLKIGGAHMSELRRTRAAIFSETDKEFVTMYNLEKAFKEYKAGNEESLRKILIPAEIISKFFHNLFVNKEVAIKLLNGSPLFKSYLEKELKMQEGEKICIINEETIIGIYNVVNQKDRVAMPEAIFCN